MLQRLKKCPPQAKKIFSWTNGGQKRNANFSKTLYNNKLDQSTILRRAIWCQRFTDPRSKTSGMENPNRVSPMSIKRPRKNPAIILWWLLLKYHILQALPGGYFFNPTRSHQNIEHSLLVSTRRGEWCGIFGCRKATWTPKVFCPTFGVHITF